MNQNPYGNATTPRGFALIYFMLVTTVTFMLVGGLVSMTREQLFGSSVSLQNDKALYAAQAGLADAISNLESSITWNAGFSQKTVLNGTSTYTVHFATSAPTSADSVNNLANATPADSYLGPGTVPAYTALIVVQGREGGFLKTVEALVGGGSSVFNYYAISSSGAIHLDGAVNIYGIDSLGSASSLPAGIHSNSLSAGAQISWTTSGSTRANISGQVAVSSSNAGAISFAGTPGVNYSVGSQVTGSPQLNNPHYDIPALVSAQSGASGPPLVAGPTGVITIPPGNYYYGASQNLAADVILSPGAHLYINGDLQVTGSISGGGSVMVTGNTSFYGSANLASSDGNYVALMSQGHVQLQGFDGTNYLNTLATQSAAGTLSGDPSHVLSIGWGRAQSAMADLQVQVSTLAQQTWSGSEAKDVPLDTSFDTDLIKLSNWPSNWLSLPYTDSLGDIVNHLPSSGASANFLKQRLSIVRDMLRPSNYNSAYTMGSQDIGAITAYKNGTYMTSGGPVNDNFYSLTWGGLVDTVESLATISPTLRPTLQSFYNQMANSIHQVTFDQLGAATFQGIIYTNGGLLANSELNVVGGLIAESNGQAAATMTTPSGTVTVQPGEIYLRDGTNFTYVKSMFSSGTNSLVSAGVLSPLTWRVR